LNDFANSGGYNDTSCCLQTTEINLFTTHLNSYKSIFGSGNINPGIEIYIRGMFQGPTFIGDFECGQQYQNRF